MGKKKIVIIRGKTTAGKSTISYELAKNLSDWIYVDIWKIKEMFEPLGLKDRSVMNDISKKAIFKILRRVMRDLKLNIIIQESTQSKLKKILRKDLKEQDYKVYSFFLDVDMVDAIKRDVEREKPTMRVNKKNLPEEEWKKKGPKPEKKDIMINTSNHKISDIVKLILKEIGEKRKIHKNPSLLRKTI